MSADSAGLLIPPGTPFVDKQSYPVLRIIFIHDFGVLSDYIADLETFAECPVIIVVGELCGRSFRSGPVTV